MAQTLYGESWIEQKVAERLQDLESDPTPVLRYDLDGDGKLSEEEWEVVRTIVGAEVCNEARARRRRMGIKSPDDTSEIPIADPSEFDAEPAEGDITGEFSFDDFVEIDPEVREEIAGRYTVLRRLGRGGQGDAYLARNVEKTRFVALKELSFEKLEEWKALELFRRESALLEKLDHRGIPGFLETFEVETDSGPRFFMVQQYIEGDNLLVRLKRGELFDETRVVELAVAVLEILVFLQAFSPPIIHRDIKPANLIERPTGELVLVDFGAVMEVVAPDVGGSTVVGTTGYMPPEQLMGRAHPSSDLFGLGTTLIHLLTRRHPTRLPVERMKLRWREHATSSDALAEFVDKLVEPVVEDRYESAAEALRDLNSILDGVLVARGGESLAPVMHDRPQDTFVSIERGVQRVEAKFPVRTGATETLGIVVLAAAAAAYAVLAFLSSTLPIWPVVGILAILVAITLNSNPSTILLIDREWGWRLTSLNRGFRRVRTGKLEAIEGVRRENDEIRLVVDGKSHVVATGLRDAEIQWAMGALEDFLDSQSQ